MNELNLKILQYEKASEINILAGGIAHEFNNLLYGISGYIEVLENYDDADIKKISEKIRNLIDKAEQITDRLLNLSRIENAVKTEFLPEIEIQAVVDLYKYKIKEHGITVKLEFQNAKQIYFNISDFNSIISNLLINAIDAVIEKQNDREIKIKTYSDSDYYNIVFWDSGIGIDNENIDKIFKPFFTTKIRTSLSGAGLGLAFIRKIIFENNGEIKVFSEKNKFTEFHIKLPLFSKKKIDDSTEFFLDTTIEKTVYFIDNAAPENFIIRDFLEYNNIIVFDDLEKIDCANEIIIDDRIFDKLEYLEKLRDKNII
ncbi:MAG TPA: HAMP domain-containing sensor histidine kinase, partial [bacterium]|nr:HAMP domain-containing sensor histidine kinase [bacterium]